MTLKEGLTKALFVAALSVASLCLQKQVETNFDHENRITVLEESKADKEVVTELRIQMGRQTEILQTQSKIMEQQNVLLQSLVLSDTSKG